MIELKYIDTRLTTRYQETDMMGVIHHSVYPIWFEAARTEFIKVCGYSYSSLEKLGLFLPLISLNAEYVKPAFYEDKIVIRSRMLELTKTRLTISYEVYRENDYCNIISKGRTIHVFTDKNLKPINVQRVFPEVYEALNSSYK